MKEFKELLNKYFNVRIKLMNISSEYEKTKAKCRRYLKAENQRQIDLFKFAQDNDLKIDEIINEWNENVIPCTLMPIKDIRKTNEEKCRNYKKQIKECEIEFNQVCKEMINYLSHDNN
jgi:nitrate/nitrite-specific signal transduction histidine kinase